MKPDPDRQGPLSLFVDRPVLTLMVALTLCSLGVLAFTRLSLRLVPADMASANINVWVAVNQSMTPREVEDQILKPFEAQVRTIPGIAEIRSSAESDSAFLRVEIDADTDLMLAAAEIRDRAQRAKLEWPRGVDQYFTWREDGNSAPLAFFQILTPDRDRTWDDRIDRVVRTRLESVDGVGRAEIWGLLAESIRIWFDRDKLIAHRIDYGALIRRLSADNFARPIGEIDDGQHRYLARVDSKFHSQTDIENYPVRPGLLIKDIARVERVPSVRDSLARFDQKFAYTGVLRLAAGSNPVDASRAVRDAMHEMESDPELTGIGFRRLFDQGETIEKSLETLLETSIQGGLLALIALFAFLRNVRATIAIALAIPLALLIAGAYLFFAGRSLNILTMAGMTLAVGMVVDNSVVVLENIRRLRETGMRMRDAAVQGTREIVLAITMATLTTVVVILPLVFMSSDTQLRPALTALGMTLSVALLGSLFVALLLLPSGMRHLGAGIGESAVPRHERKPLLLPVRMLVAVNRRILDFGLRHRWLALIALIGVVVTAFPIGSRLDFHQKGGGPFRGGDVSLYLELPRGRTLRDVSDEVRGYEEFLLANRETWHIQNIAVRFDRTSARFDLILDETVARERIPGLTDDIRDAWPRRPGVELTMRERSRGGGGGGGSTSEDDENSSHFVLRLYGPDSEYLTACALDVSDLLGRRSEVERVEIDRVEGNQEVIVGVDRQALSDFGVAPETLNRIMSSGLRGMELTRFEDPEGDVRLIAQFDSERNPSLVDLKETQVWTEAGTFQRLADLSDIRFQHALERIQRIDGRTAVQLSGKRAEGVSSKQMSDVLAETMTAVTLPRGYSWSEASESGKIGEQLGEVFKAMILSVALVFMLMGVLFESVVLPAAILVTVPFALTGAIWSLFLFYGSIDVMAGIG
ncbi:MAG: efflux RND transporter permease subunit, partial [Planctomycetes bacterium]|nr:efflux RND transporter permease subunit [Planctomycetota bacterium]